MAGKTVIIEDDARVAETDRRLRYRWVVLAAAFLTLVLAFGAGNYTFGIFLKPVLADFGWSRGVTSVAFSSYMMGFGVFGIATGILADRYGSRLTTALGGLLMGLGYVLLSQVSSLWQLYLYYGLLVGGGIGSLFSPLSAAVAGWFERRRGLALGILTGGIGVGAVVMPTIAERVISSNGWRAAYMTIGIMCGSVIVAASLLMRRPPRTAANRLETATRLSLAQAAGTRLFWTVTAMYLLWGAVFGFILAHLAAYATDSGLSSAAAAGIISVMGFGSIFGRVSVGWLSDSIGIKRSFVACFAVLTLAVLWLMYARGPWMFYVFALVFGFFYGGHIPLWPAVVGRYFGIASMGAIFGVILLGSNIGVALGSPLSGAVYDATQSYYMALLVGAIVTLITLLLALSLPASRRQS